MSKVEKLEREIKALTSKDLDALRDWFLQYDSDAWDQQIEADIKAGKLNHLKEEAMRAYRNGKTTRL